MTANQVKLTAPVLRNTKILADTKKLETLVGQMALVADRTYQPPYVDPNKCYLIPPQGTWREHPLELGILAEPTMYAPDIGGALIVTQMYVEIQASTSRSTKRWDTITTGEPPKWLPEGKQYVGGLLIYPCEHRAFIVGDDAVADFFKVDRSYTHEFDRAALREEAKLFPDTFSEPDLYFAACSTLGKTPRADAVDAYMRSLHVYLGRMPKPGQQARTSVIKDLEERRNMLAQHLEVVGANPIEVHGRTLPLRDYVSELDTAIVNAKRSADEITRLI